MKICITATNPTMDSLIDPHFGRCQYFLIISEKGELIKAIPNEAGEAARGAGISAAQMIADEKVQVIITGSIGPNAYRVLYPSKIKIFTGVSNVSIKQAYISYQNNELKESGAPQPSGHGHHLDHAGFSHQHDPHRKHGLENK